MIVDDLVQTGGTLYKCGLALKEAGALDVSAFVAHAVFPNMSWKKFSRRSTHTGINYYRSTLSFIYDNVYTSSVPKTYNISYNDKYNCNIYILLYV